jgi:SAM-dependent methyltransferase
VPGDPPAGQDFALASALVRGSFAPAAERYRRSPRHADPASLRRMLGLVAPGGSERVLDVATGGGHTAAAVAPFVRRVTALDLLPEMLRETRLLLSEARVRNADLVCGDVHALPFGDGSFDLVTCRSAPHHFADVSRALAEIARCLTHGGRFYLLDCGVPDDPEAAAFVNQVERARDPSHVRSRSAAEWSGILREAGLEPAHVVELPHAYDVPRWLDDLGVTPERRRDVLDRLGRAPSGVRARVGIDLTPGRETFATCRTEALAVRRSG